ncbi:MAG TPA: hypothetical protein VMU30_03440 [Bacteroidota bacterium]|nr:hypothetical protein [Bacteroidota bacterium]
MKYGNVVSLIFCICLCGCAVSNFSQMPSIFVDSHKLFTFTAPPNWYKYKHESKDSTVVMTVDGLELQYIRVAARSTKSNLSNTKRKITKGMVPQELADVFIDDLKSDHEMMNLEILDNQPATIREHEGFQFEYRFITPKGLKKKGVMCGYLENEQACIVQYVAAEQVYFQKDFAAYESVKSSLR